MNLWFLLLFANLADKINSAPAPSYVVNVKDTKMPSTLPVDAPTFPAANVGMGDYHFASGGIVMTAANGRKFRCFMDSALRAAGHGDDKTMSDLVQQLEQKKERKVRKVKRKVKKVVKRKKLVPSASASKPGKISIDSFRSSLIKKEKNCVILRAGYWTYEVCPFKTIRQYHVPISKRAHPDKKERMGKPTENQEGEPLFILGKYMPHKDEIVEGIYTQHFQGGSDNRKSVVSYHCNNIGGNAMTDSSNTNAKLSIEEPSALNYAITLKTAAVCQENIVVEPTNAENDEMEEVEYEEVVEVEEEVEVEDDGNNGREAPYSRHESSKKTLVARVQDALKPLKGVCLRFVESWWTYELCVGGKIRQFHAEKKSNNQDDVITMEFTLGKYDKQRNLNMASDGTAVAKVHPYSKFLQYYGKGTNCDLTKEPRVVNVEYECSNSQHTYIMGIVETSTCTYKMSVATPLLCKLKEFDYLKKKDTSHENIRCFPADA